MRRTIVIGAAMGLLGLCAFAESGDDDLAIVKRAVAETRVEGAKPEQAAPAVKEAKPSRRGAPQWFKIRVVEKGSKKARVTVNLPLAVARAVGDELFDLHCSGHHHCSGLNLSEVLADLEAGQSLVEIDDDEATVRIWVE